MKKYYEKPELLEFTLAFENNLLRVSNNGEDLNRRSYGSEQGENANDFWR